MPSTRYLVGRKRTIRIPGAKLVGEICGPVDYCCCPADGGGGSGVIVDIQPPFCAKLNQNLPHVLYVTLTGIDPNCAGPCNLRFNIDGDSVTAESVPPVTKKFGRLAYMETLENKSYLMKYFTSVPQGGGNFTHYYILGESRPIRAGSIRRRQLVYDPISNTYSWQNQPEEIITAPINYNPGGGTGSPFGAWNNPQTGQRSMFGTSVPPQELWMVRSDCEFSVPCDIDIVHLGPAITTPEFPWNPFLFMTSWKGGSSNAFSGLLADDPTIGVPSNDFYGNVPWSRVPGFVLCPETDLIETPPGSGFFQPVHQQRYRRCDFSIQWEIWHQMFLGIVGCEHPGGGLNLAASIVHMNALIGVLSQVRDPRICPQYQVITDPPAPPIPGPEEIWQTVPILAAGGNVGGIPFVNVSGCTSAGANVGLTQTQSGLYGVGFVGDTQVEISQ